jgi:photosystem II stability/assembly factor-like uncharacterized protein
MKIFTISLGICAALMMLSRSTIAVAATDNETVAKAIEGLKLREIGPAMMGGRIADIAVDPKNTSTWYVAVGSGGIWKTTNAGTTFTPIFDKEKSYSTGTVAIDPSNSDVIWVGTGENVSGRHVGWGDGVYKSLDGGKSWKNMGLKDSQHVSKFLFHPSDNNIVYVAAEGPLWSAGGDRGVYKTIDGGKSWKHVLEIDENTGVTDIEFAPGDADTIYAAAYQRRRSTWALLGGGPKSGIYKSSDSGETWDLKRSGLPESDMGKIGMAITAAAPSRIYATIEANSEEKGMYRSDDKGESWEKLNDYVSGGTGPHYYQELEASQSDANLVYQMDVFLRRSNDGGKTFNIVGTAREKHSDNHAMWIDPTNGDHYLVGSDAGLYETFDQGITYRHFGNMPVSQFYKVAVDNAEPFYNILGGAQDLGTLYGPSRTMHTDGVRNRDWYVPLGADGYGVAFHPKDDNIMYMMWQGGSLMRHDKTTEEGLYLTPTAAVGDAAERWNWDSPLLQSPHKPDRIYYGSQRVWQSDDRGNSWTAISPDLTKNQNRYTLKMTDKRVWGIDALYDTYAMSLYNTTTTLSESPVAEGTLYAGTDDGIIQYSSDGGKSWSKSAKVANVPSSAFIQDVEASLYDSATVFAAATNHKVGDFKPYVVESKNGGKSWKSIAGDLPKGVITWAIEQDHKNKDLLFLGAENGLYFTVNRGKNWHKMSGAPTTPFRDVKIQRRDNDIVGATFGRGFYVLDDYSALRDIASGALDNDAALFPVRDAWWYVPFEPGQAKGSPTLGSTGYDAANPDFGATFTYYLASDVETAKKQRHAREKSLREKGADVPFPGYDALKEERLEAVPSVMVIIKDSDGKIVNKMKAEATAGINRVSWSLRRPAPNPINLKKPTFVPPWAGAPLGPLVAPGIYTAELSLVKDGVVTSLDSPQNFTVKPLPNNKGVDHKAVVAFQEKTSELARRIFSVEIDLEQAATKLRHMRAALDKAPKASAKLHTDMEKFGRTLDNVTMTLFGDKDRGARNTATNQSIANRVYYVVYGHWSSTQMPTKTMVTNLDIASLEFEAISPALLKVKSDIVDLDAALAAAGAPSSR